MGYHAPTDSAPSRHDGRHAPKPSQDNTRRHRSAQRPWSRIPDQHRLHSLEFGQQIQGPGNMHHVRPPCGRRITFKQSRRLSAPTNRLNRRWRNAYDIPFPDSFGKSFERRKNTQGTPCQKLTVTVIELRPSMSFSKGKLLNEGPQACAIARHIHEPRLRITHERSGPNVSGKRHPERTAAPHQKQGSALGAHETHHGPGHDDLWGTAAIGPDHQGDTDNQNTNHCHHTRHRGRRGSSSCPLTQLCHGHPQSTQALQAMSPGQGGCRPSR